jgi:hypothetical protein
VEARKQFFISVSKTIVDLLSVLSELYVAFKKFLGKLQCYPLFFVSWARSVSARNLLRTD